MPFPILEFNPNQWNDYKRIRMEALADSPDAFGEMLERVSLLSDTEWRNQLAERIKPDRQGVIYALDEGKIVGMSGFGLEEETPSRAYVWGMYVSPAYRRCGLGARIVDWIENWVTDHGGTRLRATVAAPNDSAIEFYKRIGFTVTPTDRKLREGSEIPAYEISKELNRLGPS